MAHTREWKDSLVVLQCEISDRLLFLERDCPPILFIVDRLDLMIQAQREFSYRGLKVNSVQTKEDFAKILSSGLTTQNREGKPEITVVNIQKFSNDSKALPKNAYNVPVQRIYFIDEAHRNYSPDGCFLKILYPAMAKQ